MAWVLISVTGLILFALGSFFFALCESALFSLAPWQVKIIREKSGGTNNLVDQLLAHHQDLLSTILLGNTLSNGGVVASLLTLAMMEGWSMIFPILFLFITILFIGELIPKTIGVRAPEIWSARIARPMWAVHQFLSPIRKIGQWTAAAMFRAASQRSLKPQAGISDGEYQELVDLAFHEGTLGASEKEIILQIVNLEGKTARDVMKARSRMACISDDCSVDEMLVLARKFQKRRLPIYDETPDVIVGILNTRALLLNPQIDLADAIEFPSFVPETMNLLQLLKSLQKQQRGLAIVLDEFGGTAGIVTLEDILEEIIGKIKNEHVASGFVIEKLGPGKWRVNGITRLEDFRRECPEIGIINGVETVGGLMVNEMQVVPAAGESLTYRGVKLTAKSVDDRRVKELLIEVTRKK